MLSLQSKIAVEAEGNFAVQLHATQAGYVTIGLRATSKFAGRSFTFKDEVQIQVTLMV